MSSELAADITSSLQDIGNLLGTYRMLLDLAQQQQPDEVELAALATVLHSFYNGAESIFLNISKSLDDNLRQEGQWHRALLNAMIRPTSVRPAVLSIGLAEQMSMYMQFRHFFRHAYAFQLRWDRMKPLVDQIDQTWNDLQEELLAFAKKIS